MRRTALLLVLLALAAFVAVGCGGPDDPKKSLAEACERQIEEVNEESHSGDTKETKSTTEFVDNEKLVECAGQPSLAAGMESEGGEGSDSEGEGSEGDAMGGEGTKEGTEEGGEAPAEGEETTPVLDEAALAAERDTFKTTCASCHELADAEATGSFGPSLDESTMSVEDMTTQIENGGGGMPPGLLTGDDAATMAQYIDQVRAG